MRLSRFKTGLLLFLFFLAICEFCLIVRYDVINRFLVYHNLKEQQPEDRDDYRCLKGWENTLAKLNYKADVCFFGHSIIADADFQKDYPNLKTVNLGYSGDDLDGMIVRHKMIYHVHPSKIFIMAGINDLKKSRRPTINEVIGKYNQLLDSIQGYNPQATIYLVSLLPINKEMAETQATTERIQKTNDSMRSMAKNRSIEFVDIYHLFLDKDGNLAAEYTYDGIHLNTVGYVFLSETLRSYLLN